jgi:hypothetical protein
MNRARRHPLEEIDQFGDAPVVLVGQPERHAPAGATSRPDGVLVTP